MCLVTERADRVHPDLMNRTICMHAIRVFPGGLPKMHMCMHNLHVAVNMECINSSICYQASSYPTAHKQMASSSSSSTETVGKATKIVKNQEYLNRILRFLPCKSTILAVAILKQA